MNTTNTMKKMTLDTMQEFSDKLEYAKQNFIPMLPFVKFPFHNFDRYKTYSDKGIFLIDYVGEDWCLYHLYHLTEGDDTLRATLVLPSSWERRFEIIEKSIPNLKEWFLKNDLSSSFIIQSLEYGEIEYYPTLSHYMIPTIIRNGFHPEYRMYMKRDSNSSLSSSAALPEGFTEVEYTESLLDEIIDFNYKDAFIKNYNYFTNCTYDEFLDMFKQEFTAKHSRYIKNAQGKIVAGCIISMDNNKVWADNLTVHPEYDELGLAEYLLKRIILDFTGTASPQNIYIYLNRNCFNAIKACEKNGFIAFEFWTDMILRR